MKVCIGILFIICLFVNCSCGDKYQNKGLEQALSELSIGDSFGLDTINKSDWDSLLLIPPYYGLSSIEKYNIQLSEKTKKNIEDISLHEGYSSLLFLKHREVINYSLIPRNVADFALLGDSCDFLPFGQHYKLDKERRVSIYCD